MPETVGPITIVSGFAKKSVTSGFGSFKIYFCKYLICFFYLAFSRSYYRHVNAKRVVSDILSEIQLFTHIESSGEMTVTF